MDLIGFLRRFAGPTESDVRDARERQAEARRLGLLPDDWDGATELRRCELCHAYNDEQFRRCRICAERLPRTTVVPERPQSPSASESGH